MGPSFSSIKIFTDSDSSPFFSTLNVIRACSWHWRREKVRNSSACRSIWHLPTYTRPADHLGLCFWLYCLWLVALAWSGSPAWLSQSRCGFHQLKTLWCPPDRPAWTGGSSVAPAFAGGLSAAGMVGRSHGKPAGSQISICYLSDIHLCSLISFRFLLTCHFSVKPV